MTSRRARKPSTLVVARRAATADGYVTREIDVPTTKPVIVAKRVTAFARPMTFERPISPVVARPNSIARPPAKPATTTNFKRRGT